MIMVDKSLFSPEELAQYEALIAKGSVDVSDEEQKKFAEVPEEKNDKPADEEEKKEDGVEKASPELAAALERLDTLEKSAAMKEFTETAKKYAPLGEKEEDLAKSLYEMKKSSEANYNAYIGILDKSLALVEKSGVFAEIGKSASGTSGNVLDKVNAAADEIQKSDATMTREQAVAKAWTDHPEFVAEYEETLK